MTNDPVLFNDWHPVATVADLDASPVAGIRLLDEDIVVWRGGTRLHAWRDACVHRGTRLSLGKIIDADCIQCPYHGWVYDSEGQCIRIPAMPDHTPPARARIESFRVREQYGLVWVCMGQPANDIAPFPEWHNPEFRKLLCGPYPVQTSGPRIIENFLDVAHFPITVCYWTSLEAISAWKNQVRHRQAQKLQKLGKSKWYRDYSVKVCRVEKDYSFE